MRTLIFLIMFFCFSCVNAQKYLFDLRIKKIQYEEDSTVNDVLEEFEILTDKTTEIVNLGKVGDREIAIQLEILKSELEGTLSNILAKVYYYRNSKNEDWQRITKFNHDHIKVSDLKTRVEAEQERLKRIKNAPNERIRKMFSQTNSNSSSNPDFQIDYLLFVYRNK